MKISNSVSYNMNFGTRFWEWMGGNNGNENVKYYVSKESILILQATVVGVLQSRRRAAAAFQFNFAHCGCWDMCSLALSTSQSSSSSSKSSVHFAIPSGKRFPATHEPQSHMPQLILTQYKSDFIIIRFRWDYLEHFQPRGGRFPGFDNFRRGGVETEYLQSVFPSESFPAWQTINTGSYFFFLNPFLAYIIEFVELLFIVSDVVSINTSAAAALAAASETQNVLLSPPTYLPW